MGDQAATNLVKFTHLKMYGQRIAIGEIASLELHRPSIQVPTADMTIRCKPGYEIHRTLVTKTGVVFSDTIYLRSHDS